MKILKSKLELRILKYSWEEDVNPGKLESFVQEKEVGVYEMSKISILREMDKNMQNDSVYTFMVSKNYI